MMRGDSFHHFKLLADAARLRAEGRTPGHLGSERMVTTRTEVITGWNAAANVLDRQGHDGLAAQVRRFVAQMPKPRTEIELLADRMDAQARLERNRDRPLTR
jgi:hypothetical protein